MKKIPFFTKEILDVTSFGSVLRQRRRELGKTLEQASADLKIGTQYLAALEEEALNAIPGIVYVKQFTKAYAEWLGVRDAYHVFEQRLQDRPREDRMLAQTVSQKELMVFPRMIKYTLAFSLSFALVGYLLVQVYLFLLPPNIVVASQVPITHQKEIVVSGRVDNAFRLMVNGKEVPVADGTFRATATLVSGLNTVSIEAVNRTGKTASISTSVYFAKARSSTGSQISLR